MEKLYKRFIIFIILPVIVAAFPFLVFANSENTRAYDWYFVPASDNKVPSLCPEADFIQNYDVITVDKSQNKNIYLTFDAGFDNGNHTKILDTLKEKNVTAAFFIDGNFVKSNAEIVKRMDREGHLVCNHSLNHPDMTKITDFKTYSRQITEWETLVNNLGVSAQKYFRFPQGRFSKLAMDYNKKLGLTTVFWSFAYYDWVEDDQPQKEKALEKISSRVHDGAVLLLHSTSATNTEILAEVIDSLRAQGFTFKSLDEFKK